MCDVENDDLRLGFQPLRRVGGAAESCWETGFDASADEADAAWHIAVSSGGVSHLRTKRVTPIRHQKWLF